MSQILKKRIAIITGGDSGIGAASSRALAEAGADVAILYHKDQDGAQEVAGRVEAKGGKATILQCDVTDETAVEAAFDHTNETLGRPDILVNSAGMNMQGVEVIDMDTEQWETMIRTDLTGSFFTSRRFARDLKKAGGPGAIINITSIHSTAMRAGGADYCAAKGAQRNLTKTMALELARDKITVNAIAPGMILTPMNEKAMENEDYREKLEKNIPLGRAADPEEIAQMVVYLASPAGRYMTGSSVTIDGGLSLLLGQGA